MIFRRFSHFIVYLRRRDWTFEEDIKLLAESLKNPKKWSVIAKKIPGRTQHNVKNRFIVLLCRENQLTREDARKIMMGKRLVPLIQKTLNEFEFGQFANSDELQLLSDDRNDDSLSTSLDVAIKYLGEAQYEEKCSFFSENPLTD